LPKRENVFMLPLHGAWAKRSRENDNEGERSLIAGVGGIMRGHEIIIESLLTLERIVGTAD
jgi:hypothetical protein